MTLMKCLVYTVSQVVKHPVSFHIFNFENAFQNLKSLDSILFIVKLIALIYFMFCIVVSVLCTSLIKIVWL